MRAITHHRHKYKSSWSAMFWQILGRLPFTVHRTLSKRCRAASHWDGHRRTVGKLCPVPYLGQGPIGGPKLFFQWALEPTPYPRLTPSPGHGGEGLLSNQLFFKTSVPRNLSFHPWLGGSFGTAVRSPVPCRHSSDGECCPFVRACLMGGVGGSDHGPIAGPWLLTGRRES